MSSAGNEVESENLEGWMQRTHICHNSVQKMVEAIDADLKRALTNTSN